MTDSIRFNTLLPIIGFSMFLFLICMTIFGYAVEHELNRLFAPRSWARPREIIKNQIKKPYCFSWIFWALRISYSEMLEGIEGTGTRKKGLSGTKLRCNLDGIILIKFVNLCLKVSVLATILCVGIVLPVNFTAKCVASEYGEEGNAVCQDTSNVTLTQFEMTTFSHIPSLVLDSNTTWYSPDLFTNAFNKSTAGVTLRMLTTVIVCFIIYTYTCVLIWEEWIQNLALRRVYYLEYNHYERRKSELEYLQKLEDPEDINTTDRPIFVVHPEFRDTVPNIGLYSVLFRLPGVNLEDDESRASNSDSGVNRQLKVAIEFFDKIVPNQPGFSSSIAALTILPDTKRLSQAWKKWFECAGKVRRLKFIRQRLKELENDKNIRSVDDADHQQNISYTEVSPSHGIQRLYNPDSDTHDALPERNTGPRTRVSRRAYVGSELETARHTASIEIREETNMEMYLNDDETEQMAVYYREFARSSASCGPRGCDEHSIRQADYTTLKDFEQEAAEEVHLAIQELHRARKQIKGEETSLPEIPEIHSTPSDNLVLKDEDDHELDFPDDVGELSSHADVERGDFSDTGNMFPNVTLSLWEEAEKLVGTEQYMVKLGNQVLKRKLNTGRWYNPFAKANPSEDSRSRSRRVMEKFIPSGVLSKIAKSESYAVVTFTSRQAAIAARQCLSDGSGLEGWREVDKIPIPPLADAVPWNIFDCRGCCRPVTVTIPPQQRRFRFKIVVLFLIVFSTIWTYPFYLFTSATTPEALVKAFKEVPNIEFYAQYLSPWLNSGIMILFFAILPQIFKMLANSDGTSTSIQEAERHALVYYWWFMLVFVFAGKSLGNIVWSAFRNNQANLESATSILQDLAKIVPTTQSFYWITWMITQTGIILPFMYFLQFNNFMFTALRWHCCARATAGGGPGGVVPYRVYVNSGVIFLCVVALAPLCPMVAPFSTLFFLFITPLLKWGFIFVYRPTFDAGGMRWPLLHRILMISVIVSQILLALSLFLKKAYLLVLICVISIIPTWTFKTVCEDTFLQSFDDAALLQTSELDGWNVNEQMSFDERERYRKWIVDCHKAAYVPVCVNAEDNYLTSEPAVVVDMDGEGIRSEDNLFQPGETHDSREQSSTSSVMTNGRQRTSTIDSYNSLRSQKNYGNRQPGAIYRRMSTRFIHLNSTGENNTIISEECESKGSPNFSPRQFEEVDLSTFLNEDTDKSL